MKGIPVLNVDGGMRKHLTQKIFARLGKEWRNNMEEILMELQAIHRLLTIIGLSTNVGLLCILVILGVTRK